MSLNLLGNDTWVKTMKLKKSLIEIRDKHASSASKMQGIWWDKTSGNPANVMGLLIWAIEPVPKCESG